MNRFIIADASKCIGCRTCEVACVVSHQENQDCASLTPETFLPRIHVIKGVNISTATVCRQCEDAPCANVCPNGAISRDKGFVHVMQERCIGCKTCVVACPYGAPQYNETKGHMTKCDGCYDRVAEGKKPICVESCPLRALDFGPIDELRKKHGDLAAVAPLPRAHFTKPNIVIKPNANSRPTGDTTGYLANPKEV
jgi:anaerobic dimethyl sulfoxide reductase subunit B (iron-sulfur subunit)